MIRVLGRRRRGCAHLIKAGAVDTTRSLYVRTWYCSLLSVFFFSFFFIFFDPISLLSVYLKVVSTAAWCFGVDALNDCSRGAPVMVLLSPSALHILVWTLPLSNGVL